LLWEALCDVEDRRGAGLFSGMYRWFYYAQRSCSFEAAFVRILNNRAWVPDGAALQLPASIVFEDLVPAWRANAFLLTSIRFRPRVIQTLAREAGIEPGVLDLLKKLGVTSEAELRAKLGISADTSAGEARDNCSVGEALDKLGIDQHPTPPAHSSTDDEQTSPDGRSGGSRDSSKTATRTHSGTGASVGSRTSAGSGDASGAAKRTPGNASGRPFVSYVATHPDDRGPDPDGLDQKERIALEARAIDLIVSREPAWRRTPTHNPGYDLFECGTDGQAARWCEVKAMTGCLEDRPVGLSRTQFEHARQRGSAYWLYAVEHAGTDDARIVRIQDPAGRARTFTFDRGWLDVAEVDSDSEEQEAWANGENRHH
jgi:hypothetical protein